MAQSAPKNSFNAASSPPGVANDNVDLVELSKELAAELSAENLRRALDPPYNNALKALPGGIVKDPFSPLEKLDAPETAAWVERQNAQFLDYIADSGESEKNAIAFLTDAMSCDSYSLPSRHGNKYFRACQKGLTAQARVEVSDDADGPWKTLIDPNTMSADGTVSLSHYAVSGDGKRIVYFLSEAGSDYTTMHILDVEAGNDLPDTIKNCRSTTAVLWDKGSHDSFQYNYPRDGITRRHVIGQSVEEDCVVFKPTQSGVISKPFRLNTAKYEWMYQGLGTDKNLGLLFRPFGSSDAFVEIAKPAEFSLKPVAELEDGTVLAVTNKDAPRGRLVSFNPSDTSPEKWQTMLPGHDMDVLNHAFLLRDKLFAFYTHAAADAIRVFSPEGEYLHDMPLPVQSMASFASITTADEKFSMRISGFKSRGDLYSYDIDKNELTFDKKGPEKYDLNDCVVEQLYATSKDGTQVPMTVVRHPDTKLDGTAAVKLEGYGGFKIPLGPEFDPVTLHFIRSGGIYVQANLRGGGEFGEEWYNQGRLENKQNVFDDFAACAGHLIENNYTTPKRLVIAGTSNGGLLTSATLLQHPDLFGAVVTRVPVTDMFSLDGKWKSDYGDPMSCKDDFNIAARYSPLHNVKPGAKYPPHLIITADHDDRVAPWHSYKLTATLQALSGTDNVTLLAVEKNAGHGAGKPTDKIIQQESRIFSFIEKAIGPVNQQAYKAKMMKKKKAVARLAAGKS